MLAASQVSKAPFGSSMAYDSQVKYAVLFGGLVGSKYENTTSKLVSGGWKQLHPKTSPPGRFNASMTYDAKDGYIVLFGGADKSGSLNDTWIFSNGNWSQLFPKTSPSARWDASMTYDANDGYVVLFGGEAPNPSFFVVFGDTWDFVQGDWTQVA